MRTIKSRDGMTREENDDYMLRDGESYIVGLMMMDSMRRMVHDGNGNVAGQRPGFLVCDNAADDQAREDAYREYAATVSERWRQGPGQRSRPKQDEPQTFSNPEAAVAAAYAQYNRDIQERWRK